jgi:hypothetical protein
MVQNDIHGGRQQQDNLQCVNASTSSWRPGYVRLRHQLGLRTKFGRRGLTPLEARLVRSMEAAEDAGETVTFGPPTPTTLSGWWPRTARTKRQPQKPWRRWTHGRSRSTWPPSTWRPPSRPRPNGWAEAPRACRNGVAGRCGGGCCPSPSTCSATGRCGSPSPTPATGVGGYQTAPPSSGTAGPSVKPGTAGSGSDRSGCGPNARAGRAGRPAGPEGQPAVDHGPDPDLTVDDAPVTTSCGLAAPKGRMRPPDQTSMVASTGPLQRR